MDRQRRTVRSVAAGTVTAGDTLPSHSVSGYWIVAAGERAAPELAPPVAAEFHGLGVSGGRRQGLPEEADDARSRRRARRVVGELLEHTGAGLPSLTGADA